MRDPTTIPIDRPGMMYATCSIVPLIRNCRSSIVGPSNPLVNPYMRKTEYMARDLRNLIRCSPICANMEIMMKGRVFVCSNLSDNLLTRCWRIEDTDRICLLSENVSLSVS